MIIAEFAGWDNVWSEYRRWFDRLGFDHDTALTFITDALATAGRLDITTDADTIADAVKEFGVHANERGVTVPLREFLSSAVLLLRGTSDPLKRHQVAVSLFGCRAEDLGALLWHLQVPQ